jgi:hypothetical protein
MPLLDEQYAWLQRALAAIDRARTPWVVFLVHRAMYCTKTTDPECNSEAEALRNGQLGVRAPLEVLLARYGVDFYFSGHTVSEKEWVCLALRGASNRLLGTHTLSTSLPPPLLTAFSCTPCQMPLPHCPLSRRAASF